MAKRKTRHEDPLRHACTACAAAVGEPCRAVGRDSKPLVSRATRLVHADRINQPHPEGPNA